MPGKRWTKKELAQLKRHRKLGKSVLEIYENPRLLRGKSRDAIQQQCRRNGWVDKEASESCRKGKENTLSPSQTRRLCDLIRSNPLAPLHLYESTWNAWALEHSVPTITKGIAYYLLCKMGFERSQQEVYQSDIARNSRSKRRKERFEQKVEEFELQWSLILAQRVVEANVFRRRHRRVAEHVCSGCENSWPLSKVFFNRLPASFTFGGRTLTGFQTEFCKYCSDYVKAELVLYRFYNRGVRHIVNRRLEQRRAGLDLAVENLIEEAREARDRRLDRFPHLETRECIRCGECWELNKKHFRPNRGTADGEATYRALCVFCDGYFERMIDRAKRDGVSCKSLKEERSYFLATARRQQRNNTQQRLRNQRNPRLVFNGRHVSGCTEVC